MATTIEHPRGCTCWSARRCGSASAIHGRSYALSSTCATAEGSASPTRAPRRQVDDNMFIDFTPLIGVTRPDRLTGLRKAS